MMITTWDDFFQKEKEKVYFQEMLSFLDDIYKNNNVFPSKELIFKAFELTPLLKTKVVIIGQDPYHQPGQAMGLAFSVTKGIKLPPSLRNIYKEISSDLNIAMDFTNGDLTYLATQGVLLFNPIFTVEMGLPLSHKNDFYQQLTINIFEELSKLSQPIVYVLWGAKAQKMERYIKNTKCLIIKTNHPSPLSANRGGFFGLHQFSRINEYLSEHNLLPIRWQNF